MQFKGVNMAEFCEGCPNKGNCTGQIETVEVLSSVSHGTISELGNVASFSFEGGVPQEPTDMVVRYRGEAGGASESILIQGQTGSDAEAKVGRFVDKVGSCEGPSEVKRFFGLITKTVCSAPQS